MKEELRTFLKDLNDNDRESVQDCWEELIGWGEGFEKEVSDLFSALGYDVQRTKISRDRGVDLFIGHDTIAQLKATSDKVGEPVARALYGAMRDLMKKQGLIISISGFTQSCEDFTVGKKIDLWNIDNLVEESIEIGFFDEVEFDLKPICEDCKSDKNVVSIWDIGEPYLYEHGLLNEEIERRDDAEFLKNKDGEDAGCVIDDSHPFIGRYRESWWECKQCRNIILPCMAKNLPKRTEFVLNNRG